MLREELEKSGFTLRPQGPEVPYGETCTIRTFDIVRPDGRVDTSRDFAEAQIRGVYPGVMGRFAMNRIVDETHEVTAGTGSLLLMHPGGFVARRTLQPGDTVAIESETGYQLMASPGTVLETNIVREPPFRPSQFGYYDYDEEKHKFVLSQNIVE